VEKQEGEKNRLLLRVKAKNLEESKQIIFFAGIKQSKYHKSKYNPKNKLPIGTTLLEEIIKYRK
jgi:hypothetical protein